MKYYIENLLPRVKEFSQSLDKKEIFLDSPWVTIDENNNKQKYIFKRNGELIMSFNGEVNVGKWEYLSAAKSILIDRNKDKILLNQYFVHPSIMVLKLDGPENKNMILANEIVIPDYDVNGFLKKLYYEKNNITLIEIDNGLTLEFYNNTSGTIANNKITIDGEPIKDCILKDKNKERKFEIRNSRISRVLTPFEHETAKGIIVVEQELHFGITFGDYVYMNGQTAPDGRYNIGFFENIYVLNGRVALKKQYKQVYR